MASARELITKVRKVLHKPVPRELSPTRMAEKYGADAKKKGAAKLAKVGVESAAKNEQADAVLAAQLETLQAALPGAVQPASLAPLPVVSAPKTVQTAPVSSWLAWWPWLAGVAVVGGVAYLLAKRNRK